MSHPFARPLTGEELMDDRTFSELYQGGAGRRPRWRAESLPSAPRPAPARVTSRVFDLAELGARVVDSRIADPGAERHTPGAPAAMLEAQIDRAASREVVAHASVHLARCYASVAALLLVHRGLIRGLSAAGLPGCTDALWVRAGAPSVFAEVAASGQAFRGAPPADGLDHRILRSLGREHVQEIAVLPVSLAGRVVNLLYADNGPEALGDAPAAALSAVCARVAAAWERLIREERHRQRAPGPLSR
jgi:hypothetical protein